MPEQICKSCQHSFTGTYCNQCGQKVLPRLSIRGIMVMVQEELLDVNRGLLFTFKSLIFEAGTTIRNYNQGATRKFYNPIKFLLLLLAFYFLVFALIGFPQKNIWSLLEKDSAPFSSESFSDFSSFSIYFMLNFMNVYFLLAIPFWAFIGKLIFRKADFNYPENLVFFCYFSGVLTFIVTLMILIIHGIELTMEDSTIKMVGILFTGFMMIGFFKWLKDFYQERWLATIIKGILVFEGGAFLALLFEYLLFNLYKIGYQIA